MVASIGPFWDANETWLVLGVGILLIAFPQRARPGARRALPAGRADADRADAARRRVRLPRRRPRTAHKHDLGPPVLRRLDARRRCRRAGCSGATSAASAAAGTTRCSPPRSRVALPMAYVLMGATWLIMKTEGELQQRAVQWARIAWAPMVGGLVLISMATPWVSATVRERWFCAARDHRADGHPADDRRRACLRCAALLEHAPGAGRRCAGCRSCC